METVKFFTGVFLGFFMYFMYFYVLRPSVSTVSEDAGIEPRTVATLASVVTRVARSHPQLFGEGGGGATV
jgi:hypothetical protein